jgi:phage-related tail protein
MAKFIKNINAGKITCKTRDGELVKEFPIEQTNRYNGQTIHSGFTTLTDAEFKKLSEESPGFKNALEKWKVFAVYDELPPEAKTPGETLADARKEIVEANNRAAVAEAKAAELQKQLDEANAKLAAQEKKGGK